MDNHKKNKGWFQIHIQTLTFQSLQCRCLNVSYVSKLTQQSVKILLIVNEGVGS